MSNFKIAHWLSFKRMNGNDQVRLAIYILIKIMLGNELVLLVIYTQIKITLGNDLVRCLEKIGGGFPDSISRDKVAPG